MCRYASAFHFHPTLAGMLSSTLIRNQVVEVRQPSQKCLLTAAWMVKRFHHEEFPLDGVVGLIQQGAGHGHLRVCEDRISARLFVLEPAPDTLPVGVPCTVRVI